jgi:hypothetical protein
VAEPGELVAAYAFDASGRAIATGDLDVTLDLGARADRHLKLTWNAPTASYRAKLDAGLDLSATPVRVAIRSGGKIHTGGCASLSTKLSGSAKLAANANAALKAPNVKAKIDANKAVAASAKAKVAAPAVTVKKSASATTSGDGKTGAKASAKAGISFGLK